MNVNLLTGSVILVAGCVHDGRVKVFAGVYIGMDPEKVEDDAQLSEMLDLITIEDITFLSHVG